MTSGDMLEAVCIAEELLKEADMELTLIPQAGGTTNVPETLRHLHGVVENLTQVVKALVSRGTTLGPMSKELPPILGRTRSGVTCTCDESGEATCPVHGL